MVQDRLTRENADDAVRHALQEAHQAIMQAGQKQTTSRRMGTTAVLAVQQADQVYVAGVGDSPAAMRLAGASPLFRNDVAIVAFIDAARLMPSLICARTR